MHISDVIHYFFAATPILPWTFLTFGFWLIEDGVRHKWAQKLPNILCGLVVCFTVVLSAPFLVKTMQLITGHVGHGLIGIHPFPEYPALSLFLSIVFFIVVRDFFYYWWHRTEHKVSVLWDIHAVHHSEEEFNATTFMRQHWLDGFLQSVFIQMPIIVIFQFAPEAMYAAYLIAAVSDFLGHADIKLEMGKWTFVVTGPQLHRLHHSKLKQHHDRNFAQFFPFWDVVFGSYVPPLPGEFPPTGLAANQQIRSTPDLLGYPLRSWLRRGQMLISTRR